MHIVMANFYLSPLPGQHPPGLRGETDTLRKGLLNFLSTVYQLPEKIAALRALRKHGFVRGGSATLSRSRDGIQGCEEEFPGNNKRRYVQAR